MQDLRPTIEAAWENRDLLKNPLLNKPLGL